MNRLVVLISFLSALILFTTLGLAQNAGQEAPAAGNEAIYHPHLNCWIPAGGSAGTAAPPATRSPGQPAPASRGTMTIVKSFPFPSSWSYARDAAWDGAYLYIGENMWSRINKIDPASGAVVSYFNAPASNPWGLAWDGTQLKNATITMYHMPPGDTLPDYVYTLTPTGGQVYSWLAPQSPDATPHGLAYNPAANELYLSDEYTNTIFVLDPVPGTIISSFTFPGSDPRGLTWDGNNLWAIDNPSQTLYKLTTTGTVLDTVSIAALGSDPEGLTFDGTYFWVTENATDTIYQIDIPMVTSVDIKCNGGDAGVQVAQGTNAKLDFNVAAGSAAGTPVDVWIAMKTPFGMFTFNGSGPISGWNYGVTSAYFTGPLANASGTALDRPVPIGAYKAHLGLDTIPNGVLNLSAIAIRDSVDFTVY